MKVRLKKMSVVLLASVLFLSQTGCIELWGRYSLATTTSYMTSYRSLYFAQAFSLAMLTNTLIYPRMIVPGSSSPHTVLLPPPGQTLLTRTILMTFAAAYTFNGFNALSGNPGEYRILDTAGNLIRLASIIAISSTLAYIDLNNSGAHEAEYEPTIQWQAISSVLQAFLITFPLWAGGQPGIAAYNLIDFAALTFFAGILTNPLLPGSYVHNYTLTSIDPDSGGDDDSTGTAPSNRSYSTVAMVGSNNNPAYLLLRN